MIEKNEQLDFNMFLNMEIENEFEQGLFVLGEYSLISLNFLEFISKDFFSSASFYTKDMAEINVYERS